MKTRSAHPERVRAETIWRMATVDGARCLGLHTVTGRLEAGYDADCFLVDQNHHTLSPMICSDSYSNVAHNLLMYGGPESITDVFVKGERLVNQREFSAYPSLVQARGRVMERLLQNRETD